MASLETPDWIRASVGRIETDARLDPLVHVLRAPASGAAQGTVGSFLRGEWLGHAFHPLMTDLPLGCWIGAGLLDLVGGRKGRDAARRLVGLGLLFVPLTGASGVADWEQESDVRIRRVGVVHAVGNTVAAAAYFASWRARRSEHHARGVAYAMVGGSLAWVTGYLGGHLSFALGSAVGDRGASLYRDRDLTQTAADDAAQAQPR
jgi:uncharacterized membrane protein